ncbi:MAG: glycosyltransferase family 4 protein [Patescibacteria group bacterium]
MIIAMLLKKFEPTTGKSKHLLEISRRLVDRGHTVQVITNTVCWSGPASDLDHLKINRLGGGQNALYFKPAKIAAIVRSIGAHVLEIHGGLSMTLFARRLASHSPVPVVVNVHSQPSDLWHEWRHLSWSDWYYDHAYIADIDDIIGGLMKIVGLTGFIKQQRIKAVIVPSRALARRYQSVASVHYLPSGATIADNIIKEVNPDKEELNILFFGRAVMVRGIDTLIKAFDQMADHYPKLTLSLLLLDDIDLSRVRRLAARSEHSDKIKLVTGRQAEMNKYLTAATLAAFPFRSSGCIPEQPLTLIEAMAAGLPVVTTPIGTINEIVTNEKNGLIVPPADPTKLAEAISRLLNEPTLRQSFGQAARDTVSNVFDWDKLSEQTEAIYLKAIDGK